LERGLKLVELTDVPWDVRWKPLGEVMEKHLGIKLDATVRQVTPESLGTEIGEILKSDANVCRLSSTLSARVFPFLTQTFEKSAKVGACDTLVRDKGGWWPRSLLVDATMRTFSQKIGILELEAPALVLGTEGVAKEVVGAMARTGYTSIDIVDDSTDHGKAFVEEMRRQYYQVRFEFVPFNAITTLPGVYSIVANTLPLEFENEQLDEIYFFNFLKENGVVIDLNIIPPSTPMIEEAKQLGARHLSGDFIAAELDSLMVEEVLQKKIPIEDYRLALRAAADAVPYDIAPFLKRFRDRGT
jgi:shikimate 5-dehydrogenase